MVKVTQNFLQCMHYKKYLVKMTTIAGYCSFRVH